MLRPRVIRSPTNPKWDRRGFESHFAQRALFAFYFVVSLFFLLRLSLRQEAFVNFIIS